MAQASGRVEEANRKSAARRFFRTMVILAVAAAGIMAAIGYFWWQQESRRYTLIIGTGPYGSDSYTLMREAADVVKRHSGTIRLDIRTTRDPSENIALLNRREIDLAAIRTDTPVAADVRLVTNLYQDYFQLVVRSKVQAFKVHDLHGMKIAIPPFGTDAFRSFWIVASHYNLPVASMEWTASDFTDAQEGLLDGTFDALFTVRSLRDRQLLHMFEDARLKHIGLRYIPIDQANAIALKRPFIAPGMVPAGAFDGAPSLPDRPVETAVLDRILVTRADVADAPVRELARIMFENRLDLTMRFPLASAITAPDEKNGLGVPLHEGASQFYNRDEPGFLQENAEPLALLVTVFAMLVSGFLALRSRFVSKQKNRADRYNYQLLDLKARAAIAADTDAIELLRQELDQILETVVIALDTDEVSDEGFHSFALLWETVRDTLSGRLASMSGSAATPRR